MGNWSGPRMRRVRRVVEVHSFKGREGLEKKKKLFSCGYRARSGCAELSNMDSYPGIV